jgi:soluble lytic murein transglycosylase-like protein
MKYFNQPWCINLKRAAERVMIVVAYLSLATTLFIIGWHSAALYFVGKQEKQEFDPAKLSRYIQARSHKVPVEVAEIMAGLIHKVAREQDVPPELIVAIVEKESLFNPFAVSSAGAQGLMQILVGNEPIDRSKAHSLEYNLNVGAKILREKLVSTKGDLNWALERYSGGAVGYVDGVLACMGRYILYKESSTPPDSPGG